MPETVSSDCVTSGDTEVSKPPIGHVTASKRSERVSVLAGTGFGEIYDVTEDTRPRVRARGRGES